MSWKPKMEIDLPNFSTTCNKEIEFSIFNANVLMSVHQILVSIMGFLVIDNNKKVWLESLP